MTYPNGTLEETILKSSETILQFSGTILFFFRNYNWIGDKYETMGLWVLSLTMNLVYRFNFSVCGVNNILGMFAFI